MEILEVGGNAIQLLEKAAVVCTFILTAILIWDGRKAVHHNNDAETVEALRSILQLQSRLKIDIIEKIHDVQGVISDDMKMIEEAISRLNASTASEHRELRDENSELRRDIADISRRQK